MNVWMLLLMNIVNTRLTMRCKNSNNIIKADSMGFIHLVERLSGKAVAFATLFRLSHVGLEII